jgi:Putative beta-barrel porin-2, OmpL-like. bbp2
MVGAPANQLRSPAILTTILFVLLLSCAARAVSQSPPTSAAPAALHPQDPIEGCAKRSENQSFLERLVESYKTHLAWNGGDPAVPPTNVLGGSEVPESSPPWPYSTWNIGGTPAIGVENLYSSALMDALYCGKDGQELKDSRFTVYGWLEPGANLSTSHTKFSYQTGAGGNAPAAYDFEPNTVQLDQATLYFERTPDEIQRDHFDWGGRLALLYGTDYRYTFSQGVFSNQYTDSAKRYGFDVPMYYLDFWFPGVAMGSNVRVGRYISIPDIEAQLAPNNLTYTHSLLYTYDPFTQTGILATVKLSKNWQIQAGVNAGSDVAPWVKSERHLTAVACVQWTSDSGKDSLYPCMNGVNGGDWGWDNVQQPVLTWYHKFDAHWHTDTEAWYMWQSHTPNVQNPQGVAMVAERYSYLRVGAPFGAICNPAVVTCYSYAWALVNYINYQFGPRDIATWRTDYLDDARGQRTGFKTRYYEFDLSYTHWLGDVVELRPELRFDHARDAEAYDNPSLRPGMGKHSQAMIAMDAILHF